MTMSSYVDGVALFPGAGSDRNQSSLVLIEHTLAPLPVLRTDFPYRKAGKKAPDRAPILLDCVRSEVEAFCASLAVSSDGLVLGGRSMGGRMCSMAVAGGDEIGPPIPVAGLVLISYPLHPPGKPDKLRVEHLPRITVPCLFIHGTRDPFGTPEELQQWTATIPGQVTHVWMDRKGHDLKGVDADIANAIVAWLPTIG